MKAEHGSEFSLEESAPLTVTIVTDEEIANPIFIRDARTFMASMRIERRRLLDWFMDGYSRSHVLLVDAQGNKATIDFDELDIEGVVDWFKDWCTKPQPATRLHVRKEAVERVRVMTTLLKIRFPKETLLWGLDDEQARLLL